MSPVVAIGQYRDNDNIYVVEKCSLRGTAVLQGKPTYSPCIFEVRARIWPIYVPENLDKLIRRIHLMACLMYLSANVGLVGSYIYYTGAVRIRRYNFLIDPLINAISGKIT